MGAKPHWHVIGAGAIGCLFADALHRAGAGVTLVLREGDAGGAVHIERASRTSTVQLASTTARQCSQIDYLLVTTKAYDVCAAVSQVAEKLHQDTTVLIMVNGMGAGSELSIRHPQLRIFHGTTTAGAYRINTRHIRHTGSGATRIGAQDHATPLPWFALWQAAIPDCDWDPNINSALWHKLAINCVINPLTAIHRCLNGDLSIDATLASEVAALCAEVQQVSEVAGFAKTAETLQADVHQVISDTAKNRSSMLQDIEAGRQTEIDYITGYLLQVAADHDVSVPYNEALLTKVLSLAP